MEKKKGLWARIKWLVKNLLDTFFNDKNGFSMRKCLAWLIVHATLVLEFMYTNSQVLKSVLIINFVFAGVLLGIVTVQNIIEFIKNKSS